MNACRKLVTVSLSEINDGSSAASEAGGDSSLTGMPERGCRAVSIVMWASRERR